MLERRHILWASIAVMTGVAAVISVSAITAQYRNDLQHHRDNLREIARVQARLMEAVGRFDVQFSEEDHPGGARAATLSQIVDAQKIFSGFGKTGEFVIGERVGEEIVFLAPIWDGETPVSVAWSSTDAEPMRRALTGKSGVVNEMDYDGVLVLAAYEPVAGLDLGVVAKMDVTEIRASAVRAALFSGVAALLVIGLGAFIMHRAITPLFRRLETSEGRTRTIVETAGEGIITIDERGIIESLNPQAEEMFGYAAREVLGQNVSMLMPAPYREEHDGYLERYLRTGEAQILGRVREVKGRRKDGSIFPMELKAKEMCLGDRRVFTGFVQDISVRREAEDQLERERQLFVGGPVVVFRRVNAAGWPVEYVSPNVEELFGYTAEEFISRQVSYAQVVHPDDLERVAGEVTGYSEGGTPVFEQEYRIVRSDGAVRWLADFTVVHREGGVITHYEGYAYDATERKRNEIRQKRMMDELDHRVKNILAAVISLSQQTARGMNLPGDFLKRLTGRLMSMARTHEALASAHWEGVYLDEMVVGNVVPFATGRLDVQGERILLPARAAGPVSMTLHELATNAVKYGSLTEPEGRIIIRWSLSPTQSIHLHWEERGGPPVRKPDHTGLGISLIRGFIQHELGGEVDLDYRPSGLVVTLTIPLDRETPYDRENFSGLALSPLENARL